MTLVSLSTTFTGRWRSTGLARPKKATAKLLETMLQNIYLLPILLGAPPDSYDIWHGSNMEQPDYIIQAPPDFLPQLSKQERSWIAEQFDSFRFRRFREEYVATYPRAEV